ncbi:MAG: hypothetical protein QOG10_3956, partial [Kribbellaceae bacterium]|nr:hypothetical protein [Kribbellaceae bacterium]
EEGVGVHGMGVLVDVLSGVRNRSIAEVQ